MQSPLAPTSTLDATRRAWESALASYNRSFSKKDYWQIQQSASPQDVLDYMEERQKKERCSKHARALETTRKNVGRFLRFSGAVDMLAQGLPKPACLLWGSIKFALMVVHDHGDEYEKLLKALELMAECLPRAELYADLLTESTFVQDSVHRLYVSVLRFWERAIKFYKRRRLWNFIRVWSDYEFEFSALELEMRQCQERLEKDALAEHISKMHISQVEQKEVNQITRSMFKSQAHHDIVLWLAPIEYEADCYVDDLMAARELRHQGTCQWILSTPQFTRWQKSAPQSPESFLWIYAIPGAGKTILASFLVDEHTSISPDAPFIAYFFFKNTDSDKNTPVAAARSLLHRLYTLLGPTNEDLVDELVAAINNSGQAKSRSFRTVWDLVVKFVQRTSTNRLIIVLDALDECNGAEPLLRGLISLSQQSQVKIICTSRLEKEVAEELQIVPSLEMGLEEVKQDIRSFLEHKVSTSPKLSHHLVRSSILESLEAHSGGMFLWVSLMIKELKSKVNIKEIQEALKFIPEGLDKVYERILQRLESDLRRSPKELCCRALRWITCATRPLNLREIREALRVDYAADDFSSSAETLGYAERDLELACGSLVVVRSGTVQLIHLSAKEYLQRSEADPLVPNSLRKFFVDPQQSSGLITSHCLAYLHERCSARRLKLDYASCEWNYDPTQLKAESPLLEYASFSWLTHAAGMDPSVFQARHNPALGFLCSTSIAGWIHLSIILDPHCISSIRLGLNNLYQRLRKMAHESSTSSDIFRLKLQQCLRSCMGFLLEYEPPLKERPFEVHFIHPDNILFSQSSGSPPDYRPAHEHEKMLEMKGFGGEFSLERPTEESVLYDPGLGNRIDFFEYDPTRKCFFWIEGRQIHCQECSTGYSLRSLMDPDLEERPRVYFRAATFGKDKRYLGAVFGILDDGPRSLYTAVWLIEGQLTFESGHSASWGRKTFSSFTSTSVDLFDGSARPIALASDQLYCPSGRFDLRTGHRQDHDAFLPREDRSGKLRGLSFSSDGKVMAVVSGEGVQLLSIEGICLRKFPTMGRVSDRPRIQSLSSNGRYVLWELSPPSSQNILGDHVSGRHRYFGSSSVGVSYFFEDESRLLRLDHVVAAVYDLWTGVSIQSLGPDEQTLSRKALKETFITWFVDEAADTLYIVAENRRWRRFLLSDPSLPNVDKEQDTPSYTRIAQEISADGNQLAVVSVEEDRYDFNAVYSSYFTDKGRWKLLLCDVNHPENTGLIIDLRSALAIKDVRAIPIAFSPNLDVIILGDKVFTISGGNLRADSVDPTFTIPILSQYRSDWNLFRVKCLISSCGRFIAIRAPANKSTIKNCLRIVIFKSGGITRRGPQTIEDALTRYAGFDISFHPTKPILALGAWRCVVGSTLFKCLAWDLVTDDILEFGDVRCTLDSVGPAQFSQCGSLIFMATEQRYLTFRLPADRSTTATLSPSILRKNRHFCRGNLMLTLAAFPSCPTILQVKIFQISDASRFDDCPVSAQHLTVIPQRLVHEEATLLLGDRKNDRLRLVFTKSRGAPEIKYLMVTWDELMSRFPPEFRAEW